MEMSTLKPFNPILGETFQTKIGDAYLYLEQTSHHPPIKTFYYKHPAYTVHGTSLIEASTGPSSVTAEYLGTTYIKFKDGGEYTAKLPNINLTGVTFGTRYVNYFGNLIVEDLVN